MGEHAFLVPINFRTDIPVIEAICGTFDAHIAGFVRINGKYYMQVSGYDEVIENGLCIYDIKHVYICPLDDISNYELRDAVYGISEEEVYEFISEKEEYERENQDEILSTCITDAIANVIEHKQIDVASNSFYEKFDDDDEERFHYLIHARQYHDILDFKDPNTWWELLIEISETSEKVHGIVTMIRMAEANKNAIHVAAA